MKKLLFICLSAVLTAAIVSGAFVIYNTVSTRIEEKRFVKQQAEYADAVDAYNKIKAKAATSFVIGFETSPDYDAGAFTFLAAKDIEKYKSQYADCNTYTMYASLNDSEKLIYHALEYAFDHYHNNIFFANGSLDDVDIYKVLSFFSLDSPMMEQNFACAEYTSSGGSLGALYTYESERFGDIKVAVKGSAFNIPVFGSRHAEMHKEAYEKAESIVAGIPDGLSDIKRAEYLYRYLCENTVYESYDGGSQGHEQLYDALIGGHAECDGFANSLSLLFNLADIPCFEKRFTPDQPGVIGHTWNCFYADGEWYNADATYNGGLDTSHSLSKIIAGFGYSDKYESDPHEYSEAVPEATGDTLYKDCSYIPKDSIDELAGELFFQCEQRGFTYSLVLTDRMDDGELENVKDRIRHDVRINSYESYYLYDMTYNDTSVIVFVNAE